MPDVVRVLTLAGRSFPVCDLICPPIGDESAASRRLGGRSKSGITYYVPSENGALFNIDYQFHDDRWFLHIDSPVCAFVEFEPDDPAWLPIGLMVDTAHQALVPWAERSRLPWGWEDAEPEWIAESIGRWGRWPIVGLPDGPRAALVASTDG